MKFTFQIEELLQFEYICRLYSNQVFFCTCTSLPPPIAFPPPLPCPPKREEHRQIYIELHFKYMTIMSRIHILLSWSCRNDFFISFEKSKQSSISIGSMHLTFEPFFSNEFHIFRAINIFVGDTYWTYFINTSHMIHISYISTLSSLNS